MQLKTNWMDMPSEQYAKEVDDLLWVMFRVTVDQLQASGLIKAAHVAGWNPWETVQFLKRTDGLE